MISLGSIRWILLALAGLVVAAAVSVAASQLVSQRIGLAAAPVSSGKELAPPRHESSQAGRGGGDQRASGRTTTATTPSTTTPTTPTTTPTTTQPTTTPPSTGSQGGGGDGERPDD
jgi:hypothetical protein